MRGSEVSAEFVTVPSAAARTYNVPAAVVASIREALDTVTDHHDAEFADRLAVSGRANLDDVIRVHTMAADAPGTALRGGEAGRAWAGRIIDGVMREFDKQQQTRLDKYEFNVDKYAYAGVTAAGNEDLITHIVRFPADDSDLMRSEALTASGWFPVDFDFADEDHDTHGVGLDSELFAFTAAALIEDGVAGVLLSYGQPLCFLEEQPLLAAAPAETEEAAPPSAPPAAAADDAPAPVDDDTKKPGHVYAIVDPTDTTAVMDLIMMLKDGNGSPHVYRRNGGKWVLDTGLLEAFMSPAPPPIVELSGLHRNQIIAQVDASNANQVEAVPGEDGQAELGEGSTADTKTKSTKKNPGQPKGEKKVDFKPEVKETPGEPAPPENRPKRTPNDSEEGPNSRPPVTASAVQQAYTHDVDAAIAAHRAAVIEATDHYYGNGYVEGFSLVAALALADRDLETAQLSARSRAFLAASEGIDAARSYAHARDEIVIPALTAAANAPTDNSSPNQKKAEELRKFWLRGKGAVKIKWGTSGDFTRCVRQLRKHLGSRTEGYCARRHREANGFYPGDKRNK